VSDLKATGIQKTAKTQQGVGLKRSVPWALMAEIKLAMAYEQQGDAGRFCFR
jgi:hypothetical protein